MSLPHRPLLLVVEDEALIRQLIVLELEDAGYDIIEAENGDEALDALRRYPAIELLITDIRLPGGLNGWDIAEQARAMRHDLPVIYATGYTGELRIVPGGEFLRKPYKPSFLIERIEALGVVSEAR